MRSTPYYFEIQNVLTQFLAAFDNVLIKRFEDRSVKETIQVRYVYAPKERVLFDIVNKAQNITLPVISIIPTGIVRDESRVFNKLDGIRLPGVTGISHMGMPVPVNIGVNMAIITHYQEDMDQIISNFAPYNNPYIIISWKIPSEFGVAYEQEIRSEVLWDGNIVYNYPVDLAANQKARIEATTSFTIKSWIFPDAPKNPEKPIYFIDNNFYKTSFFTQNKLTTLEDYSILANVNWIHNNEVGTYTEKETISLSAAPSITNIEIGREELYSNYVIPPSGATVALLGKRFQYTTSVYISANVDNFLPYPPEESPVYEHYPQFIGYKLDPEYWAIPSSNTLTVTLPPLTANGEFVLIVANDAGWASTGDTGYFFLKANN